MVEVGKKYKQVKYNDIFNPECIIVSIEKTSFGYNIYHKHKGLTYISNSGILSKEEIDRWFVPIEPKKIREYRIVDFCKRNYK